MEHTIIFNVAKRNVNVLSILKAKRKSFNLWLNARSEFYSKLAEFPVTRKTVLRVNAIGLFGLIGALAVESAPVITVVAFIISAAMVYQLNKDEKGDTL